MLAPSPYRDGVLIYFGKRVAQGKNMQVRKGFTLVEILAVMGIIIVLMALVLPTVTSSMQKANIAAAKASLEKIEMAIRNYESAFGVYPTDLSYQYLGTLKTSRIFGAVRPMLQFEKTQTMEGSTSLDKDRVYKDPWGNRYFFFYYDNGIGKGDTTEFFNLRAYLKEKTTAPIRSERRNLILDKGTDGVYDESNPPAGDDKLQQGFLIWSAGPDTLNGSDDDIGNWGFTRNKMT